MVCVTRSEWNFKNGAEVFVDKEVEVKLPFTKNFDPRLGMNPLEQRMLHNNVELEKSRSFVYVFYILICLID